jgi:hypothetical protein
MRSLPLYLGFLLLAGVLPHAVRAQQPVRDAALSDCRTLVPDSVVTLRGTLLQLTFPGPPEYKSVAAGDEPEAVLTLVAGQPFCWATEHGPFFIQLVQLRVAPLNHARYHALVGQEVVLTGRLSEWETGHLHTPLLLEPRTVQVQRPRATARQR